MTMLMKILIGVCLLHDLVICNGKECDCNCNCKPRILIGPQRQGDKEFESPMTTALPQTTTPLPTTTPLQTTTSSVTTTTTYQTTTSECTVATFTSDDLGCPDTIPGFRKQSSFGYCLVEIQSKLPHGDTKAACIALTEYVLNPSDPQIETDMGSVIEQNCAYGDTAVWTSGRYDASDGRWEGVDGTAVSLLDTVLPGATDGDCAAISTSTLKLTRLRCDEAHYYYCWTYP